MNERLTNTSTDDARRSLGRGVRSKRRTSHDAVRKGVRRIAAFGQNDLPDPERGRQRNHRAGLLQTAQRCCTTERVQ